MVNVMWGTWVWEYASQSKDIQEHLEKEIVGDGWLYRQPPKEQIAILDGAPKEFIQSISGLLKPETQIKLGFNPFSGKQK